MYSISEDIWARKYRYQGSEEEGIPADENIEATITRLNTNASNLIDFFIFFPPLCYFIIYEYRKKSINKSYFLVQNS